MSVRALLRALGHHARAHAANALSAVGWLTLSIITLWQLARWGAAFVPLLLSSETTMSALVREAGLGLLLLLLLTVSTAQRDLALAAFAARFADELRQRMLRALVRQPLDDGIRFATGETVARLAGDVTLLHQSVTRTLAIWLPAILSTVVLLGACIVASPRLALATTILLTPAIVIASRLSGGLHGAVRLTQESTAAIGKALGEAQAGVREAKVFCRESELESRFARLSSDAHLRLVREERLAIAQPAVTTLFASFSVAALVLLAAWWTRTDVLASADVAQFLVLLALLIAPLQESIRSVSIAVRASTLLDRCEEIASRPIERDAPSATTLPIRRGGVHLTFDRVQHRRTGVRFALGPLSFAISPGETLVVTGASGAGKSTLLELIPRLREVTDGTIRLDGHDVAGLTRLSLRRVCAFVPQEPFFFSGTVRENLLFAAPDATPQNLADACRAAHAEEFIIRLPQGYEATLTSGATNLSVGQRRRLAIARALLLDPPLLLLDEPTAALDKESESIVLASLRDAARHRTTIIATHSPAVFTLGDRFLELRHGRSAHRDVAPMLLDASTP